MKILVTYASFGGNTMMVAEKIAQVLQEKGQTEVTLKDMAELTPQELVEYSLVFIGTSTWGDGEYNDFSHIFFEQFDSSDVDVSSVRFALFGLGESFYEVFCGAIDLMTASIEAKKGIIVGEPLKIDGYPDEVIFETVEAWVNQLATAEISA